jgi:hypothetical protein
MEDAPHMILAQQEQDLLNAGMTFLVDPASPEIPEIERDAVRKGFGGQGLNTTQGLACTIGREDQVTLIVTRGPIERQTMRHEFIHCAQVYASPETMAACLEAVENIGREIIIAVRKEITTDPTLATKEHRDLLRITTAWEFTKEQGSSAIPPPDALFDSLRIYYPSPGTRELAASLGFVDPDTVYAAITATVLKDIEFTIDPSSDLAREIVAYAFQSVEHSSIDNLFIDATARATELYAEAENAPRL